MADPDIRGVFDLDFPEQIEYFRQKIGRESLRWNLLADGTPIEGAMHDTTFIVAGAAKANLVADLQSAVDKAIAQGTGLEEFRKDFRGIVAQHGWTGWTGEGSKGGEAWRTRVIWETNLATSYAAGRYAQLTDPELLARRPYWKYIHSDLVAHPREEHLAWNNLVLRHDHPFWKTHFPPNGWGCQCRVTSVRKPGDGDKTEPPKGWDTPDEKTGRMPGIDKGWNYAPGASVVDDLRRLVAEKAAKMPPELAAPFQHEMAIYMKQDGRVGGPSSKDIAEALEQSARLSKAEGDARAWVIGRGKEKEWERIVVYDLATGSELFRNVGKSDIVLINPDVIAKAERAGQSLRTVHNHPDSVSLSIADISTLGHTVIREVEVFGADGVSSYLASRGARFSNVFQSRLKAWDKAGFVEGMGLKSHARAIFKKFGIPSDIQSHIICQALEQEGVIVYTSSLSVAHKRLYRHSLADQALAEIVAFLKNHT